MGHHRQNEMADSDPVTSPYPKFPFPQQLRGVIKIIPCQEKLLSRNAKRKPLEFP